MRLINRSLMVAGALVVLSQTAFAQLTQSDVPPQPPPGPVPTAAGGGDGGLLAIVWDDAHSVVQYLGLQLSDINSIASLAPPGGTELNFGSLAGYTANFGTPTGQVRYIVAASTRAGGQPGPSITNSVLAATSLTAPTPSNQGLLNGASGIANYITRMNDPTQCTANPCVATAADDWYAGGAILGPNLANGGFDASALAGTAQNFYRISGGSTATPPGGRPATVAAYGNLTELGQWLLNATTGNLTWSIDGGSSPVVPLPAGIWLLLSGISAMAAIGRRKKVA